MECLLVSGVNVTTGDKVAAEFQSSRSLIDWNASHEWDEDAVRSQFVSDVFSLYYSLSHWVMLCIGI